jgi:hypothetical protein
VAAPARREEEEVVRQVREDYDRPERPVIVEDRTVDSGGMGLGVILGVILAIVIAGALIYLVVGGRFGAGTTAPTVPVQPNNGPTINVNPPNIKVPDSINVNPPAQQPQNSGGSSGQPQSGGQSQGNTGQ